MEASQVSASRTPFMRSALNMKSRYLKLVRHFEKMARLSDWAVMLKRRSN